MAANGQTDTETDREPDRLTRADTGGQRDKKQTGNQAQTEREKKGERKRGCRLKPDKNPQRSTPLIGVLPPSVTLINLRESDSLSL